MGLTLKTREMVRFLEYKGYTFERARGGSHHIYSNGSHSVPIPIHQGKEFGERLIHLILKQTKISKQDLLEFLGR